MQIPVLLRIVSLACFAVLTGCAMSVPEPIGPVYKVQQPRYYKPSQSSILKKDDLKGKLEDIEQEMRAAKDQIK